MKTKIKFYRELENITQEELSNRSGVSRATLSGLENGTIQTTTNTTMERISKALNKSIFEVFYSKNV